MRRRAPGSARRSPGRAMPRIRPMRSSAPAIVAPVLPAPTIASARPSRTASAQRTSDESFLRAHRARPGRRPSRRPRCAATHARRPPAARPPAAAARRVGRPDEQDLDVELGRAASAGDDLAGRPVAAHRVDRDERAREPGRSLPAPPPGAARRPRPPQCHVPRWVSRGLLDLDDLAAAVPAAVAAHDVRAASTAPQFGHSERAGASSRQFAARRVRVLAWRSCAWGRPSGSSARRVVRSIGQSVELASGAQRGSGTRRRSRRAPRCGRRRSRAEPGAVLVAAAGRSGQLEQRRRRGRAARGRSRGRRAGRSRPRAGRARTARRQWTVEVAPRRRSRQRLHGAAPAAVDRAPDDHAVGDALEQRLDVERPVGVDQSAERVSSPSTGTSRCTARGRPGGGAGRRRRCGVGSVIVRASTCGDGAGATGDGGWSRRHVRRAGEPDRPA